MPISSPRQLWADEMIPEYSQRGCLRLIKHYAWPAWGLESRQDFARAFRGAGSRGACAGRSSQTRWAELSAPALSARQEPRRQMIDKAPVGGPSVMKAAAGARASADNPRGSSALIAASTLTFRRVVHTKVSAVVLFCFLDKKIFQNVLPVCWSERFFADSAMN